MEINKKQTKNHWNNTYVTGGNSGVGSYRKDLYEYKLNFIKKLIVNQNIKSVFDFGCGDGHQLSEIVVGKDVESYIGIDISPYIIEENKKKYKDKIYYNLEEYEFDKKDTFDLVLCLDVLYHIMEENLFNQTIGNLFKLSKKYVLIYAVDKDLLHSSTMHFRTFTNKIPNNYKLIETEKLPDNVVQTTFYLYEKIS